MKHSNESKKKLVSFSPAAMKSSMYGRMLSVTCCQPPRFRYCRMKNLLSTWSLSLLLLGS